MKVPLLAGESCWNLGGRRAGGQILRRIPSEGQVQQSEVTLSWGMWQPDPQSECYYKNSSSYQKSKFSDLKILEPNFLSYLSLIF